MSVVLPGESFLLEMLVLTVECKAGFLTAPGTEGGRPERSRQSTLLRGRRERPASETPCRHCPESVCPGLCWEPSAPTGTTGSGGRAGVPEPSSEGRERGGGRGGDRDKIWSTRDSPSRTLFVRDRFLPVHRLLGSGQLQGLQQAADIQKEQVRVPWLGKRGDQFHIRLQTQGIANNLAHVKSPLTIVKARFGNGVSPHGDVVCHAGDRRAESRFR